MSLDLGGLVLTTGLNLVFYSGWLLLCLAQPWPLAEIVLAAAVGWWCQIIATELVLGLLGRLTSAWLGGVNLLALAALLWLARGQLRYEHLVAHRQALRAVLDEVRTWPTALLLVLLALWTGWTIFLGLIFPPYASDEYHYHMPIVASILQSRRIALIQSAIPWIPAYPKNSELLVLWHSIFLHRDTFADLTMLPFLLAGGLAVYAAGRRLGAPVAGGVLAASVFTFAPTALIQAKATYNDLMVGALWAIGICFLLPSRRAHYPGWYTTALLTGSVAGLILGVKYSGVTFVIGLGLLFLYRVMGSTGGRPRVPLVGVFLSSLALSGGYWYVFNLAVFGNPLWPFQIELGGHLLVPGPMNVAELTAGAVKVVGMLPPWQRLLYAWFDRQDHFSIDSRLAGFGPLWIIVAVPSVVLWMIAGALRRAWLASILVILHLAMLLSMPLSWVPRYGLYLLTVGGCGVAVTFCLLTSWARRWLSVLTVALAIFAIFNSVDHLFFSVQRIRTFVGLRETERTGPRYDPGSFGPTYAWAAESLPRGSVIAVGNNVRFPYPLWGAAFQRRVIGITTTDPVRYVGELKAAGVRFVFIGVSGKQAEILVADPRVRRIFAGGDDWQVFEVH